MGDPIPISMFGAGSLPDPDTKYDGWTGSFKFHSFSYYFSFSNKEDGGGFGSLQHRLSATEHFSFSSNGYYQVTGTGASKVLVAGNTIYYGGQVVPSEFYFGYPTCASQTPTQTPSPTQTGTQSGTGTQTQTSTQTGTGTGTPSQTQTQTGTGTGTQTPTSSPSGGSSLSGTPTQTETSSGTPTRSSTATQTPTSSETSSQTPSEAETGTQTPSQTETQTPSQTASQTSTPSQTTSQTQTPTPTASQTPSPSCSAWPADHVRVCFKDPGSVIQGYLQYMRPGTDRNLDPDFSYYQYTSGQNGFYILRDDNFELGTIETDSVVNIVTDVKQEHLAMNSIGVAKNYISPDGFGIQVKSIAFRAMRTGGDIFLADESLPDSATLGNSGNLEYEISILYYDTNTKTDDLRSYTLYDVWDCATFCSENPVLTPSSTPSPSSTTTPSPTPSASCPAWPVNDVKVCFEGAEQNTGKQLQGYFQYTRPGTDNAPDPKNGEYIFMSGYNGMYVVLDGGKTTIQTDLSSPQIHVGVHMGVDDFIFNSANQNLMTPEDPDIRVQSLMFHANRDENGANANNIFNSDELPLASTMSHPDFISNVFIAYWSDTNQETTTEIYDITSVIDCSTNCPAMSFPSATPTPSPTPSASCIPPPSNQKKHCIVGKTHENRGYSGYYKFDTNTQDTNGGPSAGEYAHNPYGYGGLYLETDDGQILETDTPQMVFGLAVSTRPLNKMQVVSARINENPDISDRTIKSLEIKFEQTTNNPAANILTDAIPTAPLPLSDYMAIINVEYELNSEPGATYYYNPVWTITAITDCTESCPVSASDTPTPTPSNTPTSSNTRTPSNTPTPSRSEGASYSNTPSPSPAPILAYDSFGPVSDPIELIVRYTDAYFYECFDYIEAYYHKCEPNKVAVDAQYWLQCGHAICDTIYNNGNHQVCLDDCNTQISNYGTYLASPTGGFLGYNMLQSAYCYPKYQNSYNNYFTLISQYWNIDFSDCNIDLDACYDVCGNVKSYCDGVYSTCLADLCTQNTNPNTAKRDVCSIIVDENEANINDIGKARLAYELAQNSNSCGVCEKKPTGKTGGGYNSGTEACAAYSNDVEYIILKCLDDFVGDGSEDEIVYDNTKNPLTGNGKWLALDDGVNRRAFKINNLGYVQEIVICSTCNLSPIGLHPYATALQACAADEAGMTETYSVSKCIIDNLADGYTENLIYTNGNLLVLEDEWVILYDGTDKIAFQIDSIGNPIDRTICTNGGGSPGDGGGGTQYDYYIVEQYTPSCGTGLGQFEIRIPKPNNGAEFWCGDDGNRYQKVSQNSQQNYDITATSGQGATSCMALSC
jgi:hypothetical protein